MKAIKNPIKTSVFWPSNANVELLFEILRLKRPFNSEVEKRFTFEVVNSFSPNMVTDSFGNQYCQIGRQEPQVMFASHTDTVHWSDGVQNIYLDEDKGHIFAYSEKNDTNCLGADDGVGVWLMYEMIRAGVPGLYVFHRGEECGGKGARHIVSKEKHIFNNIQAVISFDRKGYNEVITHQAGKQCCSVLHGKQLAKLFTESHGELNYEISKNGVYTDSKEYSSVVSECTNIGVGYFHQHSKDEFQDLRFALHLRKALIRINWETLKFHRKLNTEQIKKSQTNYNFSQQVAAANFWEPITTTDMDTEQSVVYITQQELSDLVYKEPKVVKEILENFGGLTTFEVEDARKIVRENKLSRKT